MLGVCEHTPIFLAQFELYVESHVFWLLGTFRGLMSDTVILGAVITQNMEVSSHGFYAMVSARPT